MDVFRTDGCSSLTAEAGKELDCETALITELKTITTSAGVTAKQREWVRNVVTYKYLNGAGDSGAFKLRSTIVNAANTRSRVL